MPVIIVTFVFVYIVIIFVAVLARVLKDKHVVKNKVNDVSCETLFNHKHKLVDEYVVQEKPETGYVILNGIKRKIEDCKDL